MTAQHTAPRLYVGTYAKYNNGSISGAWLNLEDYADKDAFLEACAELHKDESDPEFMFQDFEGFPRKFYSESSVSDALFAWVALSEDDRLLLSLYMENGNSDADIEEARDHFAGEWDSLEDYVQDLWEQSGEMPQAPKNQWWHPANYIDWERMAKDLEQSGDVFTVEHEGKVYVFNNN